MTVAHAQQYARTLHPHGRLYGAITEEGPLNTISPREIQARVRSGAAPEVVAAENNWPLDKVLRYAEPVLGERAYVCELAQGVELHRSRGVVVLSDAVVARSGQAGTWDAWRDVDGAWRVHVKLPEGSAEWIFEPVGRTVQPRNDFARALMEASPSAAPAGDSLDFDDEVREEHDTVIVDRPSRSHLAVVPEATDDTTLRSPAKTEPKSDPVQEILEDMPASKAKKSRKGRAHVPSWDEILFGTKSQD